MELSPSREARRERCTLPGAELGRARQGCRGRGCGAVHTHRRPIQAGHRCMTSICLSHSPERRRLLGAQRCAVPGASRPRRRTGAGAGGRREESGGPCPGSIAQERQRRLPGASPGFRSGSHTFNRVIGSTSLCIKARLLLPPTPEHCSESLSESSGPAKAYE